MRMFWCRNPPFLRNHVSSSVVMVWDQQVEYATFIFFKV